MKRTLFLGEGETFGLPFSDVNPHVLSCHDVKQKRGLLFKEAVAEILWEKRGAHLFLRKELLPPGVTLLDTLVWLDQEAPREALLLLPLHEINPQELPKGGAWVPIVERGESPLLLYFLLLEMKEHVQGVAVKGGDFEEKGMRLLIDPFSKQEGALSLLGINGVDYFIKLKNSLL